MTLDESYGAKDEMANAIKTSLSESMAAFGYKIVKALVTDLKPDEKVLAAMNEINAQRRLREAAKEKVCSEYLICLPLKSCPHEYWDAIDYVVIDVFFVLWYDTN